MFDLGEIERTRRGIYRFAAFPASSHGHLMIATLWPTLRSPRFRAVISHESALELHGLLPANQVPAHVTLPKRASMSRMVPPEFRLHYAELRSTEVKVVDSVTTTTVARAIQDVCANRGSGHDLHALIAQALTMGMLTAGEADELALLRPR
jgi:predicted transcriptional regulator of viral defense system